MNEWNELIDRYIAVWNETDAAHRRDLIACAFTEDVDYLDPLTHAYGQDGIDTMIAGVQQRFPAHRVTRHGDIDAYRDRMRFTWRIAPIDANAPEAMHAQGTDFAMVRDGRLCKLTGFFDAMPETTPKPPHRGWSVDSFAAFWAKPDPELVPRALTPDVVGYWPGGDTVRGVEAYTQRIADLIAMVPDFRLEVAEHAANGDCVFIRWIAHGTFDGKLVEFMGVDRVRMRDGLVAENRIFCDHPLVYALARRAVAA